MDENEIITIAIESLKTNIGIQGRWLNTDPTQPDSQLELELNGRILALNILLKKEVRNYQVPNIVEKARERWPIIVIAKHLFPKIKEEFRQRQIAYLEINGNLFVKQEGVFLWIDSQKNIQLKNAKENRAFTKTGLRVIFHFLLNPAFINSPYREIASKAGIGLGNINYVINGLKEMGFLIKINKTTYAINNKEKLIERWLEGYEKRLKPALLMGTFRFLKEDYLNNWKKLRLTEGKTFWGGEPAGDLLTNYLSPTELTIYTTETRNEIIKNYRLLPDERGNIKVYKKFWNMDNIDIQTVPPLLVFADLINKQDGRCSETAELIRIKWLNDEF
jgi:hypothetical protein